MKATVSLEIKRRKSLIGWFWWAMYNYYLWKEVIKNEDVPENKKNNAMRKSYRIFVDGNEYRD